MPEEKKTAAQELKALVEAEKAFWEKQGAETPTTEQQAELDTRWKSIEELSAKVDEENKFADRSKRLKAIETFLAQPVDRPDFGNGNGNGNGQPEIKTMGEAIINAPEFKTWRESIAPEGKEMNASVRFGRSPTIALKDVGLGDLSFKDLVMSVPVTAGGGLVRRDYGPWPVDLPLRQPSIRDVITILQTGSNLIEYVRVNSLTRAAAIVPEATSATDDLALKPKASMALEVVQTGVKTIAVIMQATRTILSDAPQLQSMMTNFMRLDIDLELEEEIIAGPGGANHFTGLENTPNLTPQPFVADSEDTTGGLLTTTRKARTAAMVQGRARSTGFLLNPYDWETIDLARGAQGQFYFGGPMQMGTKMLWGLPVIESEVIPQGTGYSGDLKQLVVWDRQDPTVYITDSNRDHFERNIIDILYEGRWAFGVLRPPAVVKIDLFAGTNS
jgi:HK97 family phage major capsid protein